MQAFRDELRAAGVRAALRAIEASGLSVTIGAQSVKVFGRNGMLLIELRSPAQILHFAGALGEAPAEVDPVEAMGKVIDLLRGELAAARRDCERLSAELDGLRPRLAAAESRLVAQAGEARRYAQLKAFLAKAFHPDSLRGAAAERLARVEIFRVIWGKIGEIEEIEGR